jgi:hypothetical protein
MVYRIFCILTDLESIYANPIICLF